MYNKWEINSRKVSIIQIGIPRATKLFIFLRKLSNGR